MSAAWTSAIETLYPTPLLLQKHWPDYPRPGENWSKLEIPNARNQTDPRRFEYSEFAANKTRDFCAVLANAIRAVDATRLVTIGIQMGSYPDHVTGVACADSLDFFSVHIYPEANCNTPAALEDYFVETLNLLPPNTSKTVTWEEIYPLNLNSNISFTMMPDIMKRAAARARSPLIVQSFYSFYWGTAVSLDMSPMSAAIYNEWIKAWAAAAPAG